MALVLVTQFTLANGKGDCASWLSTPEDTYRIFLNEDRLEWSWTFDPGAL